MKSTYFDTKEEAANNAESSTTYWPFQVVKSSNEAKTEGEFMYIKTSVPRHGDALVNPYVCTRFRAKGMKFVIHIGGIEVCSSTNPDFDGFGPIPLVALTHHAVELCVILPTYANVPDTQVKFVWDYAFYPQKTREALANKKIRLHINDKWFLGINNGFGKPIMCGCDCAEAWTHLPGIIQ